MKKFGRDRPIEPTANKLDRYKLLYDFLKHLTTLSSGSILVILALAEKFVAGSPQSKWLFGGLSFFLIAILGALVAMLMLAGEVDNKKISDRASDVFATGFTVSAIMFTVGMAMVVVAIMSQYG